MAELVRGDVVLRYAVEGAEDGFPVLLLAPGGMRSSYERWAAAPWNPRVRLSDYRLICMDQRNAGGSRAPIDASDGWQTYAEDQLALLDHLGVERCHIVGMCIGGAFALRLSALEPDRVASAVLLQPIGLEENRETFYELFDGWADEIRDQHPEVDTDAWHTFRANMYDGDFVFSLRQPELSAIQTPLLVLMGNDIYHPSSTSRAIVATAPNATLRERWKDESSLEPAHAAIREFLATHTPDGRPPER